MCNCKQKCTGSLLFSACTKYEKELPTFSKITDECVSIEDTTEDIYSIIGDLKSDIDVTGLENTCITFTEPKTPSSVIEDMYNELCSLKELVETQNTTISELTSRIVDLETNNCP